MSAKELTRVEVLSRVKAGTLRLGSAATLLDVSYRQAKRLARRYRAEGAKGLKHRSAGGPSNHARPTAERERALVLVREKYSGTVDVRFGPTLAAEHLGSEDGVRVHHDTLRRWMLAAGLWSRARKRSPHRQRRERKAHFGELVQLDGSFHLWYETRAPRGCWRWSGRNMAGRSIAGLGPRSPRSIWRAKTGSRCITTRCAGGCWRRGCGVGRAPDRRIERGGSARRTSANWCNSMAVSICGMRRAPRAGA